MIAPITTQGPFAVHMTDPPWKTLDQLPGPGRGASKKYKVMSTDAICAMHTPIMLQNSVLLMWRIGCMVEDALRVCHAWGYEPKAEIVWVKMRRCGPCDGTGQSHAARAVRVPLAVIACKECNGTGERPHFGMGHHVRAAHEVCIIATRGKNIRLRKDVPSCFSARMSEDETGELIHSAKPREFYEIVERLYPGPYVETFSRTRRDGWVSLGDQVPHELRGLAGR